MSGSGTTIVGTNPNCIATALGIKAGEPFRWNPAQWKGIIQGTLLFQTMIDKKKKAPFALLVHFQ